MRREYLLQFFQFDHLPPHLQEYSRPFCELADWMVKHLPPNPERREAISLLLKAKDCAVRAAIGEYDVE